jgi:hypothetical protein
VVLFPEQCADLCDAAEGCLSFTVIGGQTGPIPLPLASCILYDVAIEDLQFVEVSLSPTTVYDIGCFSCQSDGVSTTSAADPCTLDLDPIDPESCGTVGLIGSLPDQVGFSARDDATPEVCALLCSETATCIAFAIREGEWCELWANTVEEILFTANPTSSYAAYNLGCFLGCGPLSDTTATVTVSDTGPTGNPSDCTPAENPPSPDDCGIQGVTGLPPDVIDTSYNQADLTPEGCALLCTNTDGCNSFGVGSFAENPYCELWRDEFAELQFAEISGYPFAGYDLACFTCSSVPTSVCPLLDDPPTGSVCGAVGVVEGNVDFLGDAFEPEYLTAEGCAKLCAETEDCQGLALIEDWLCELWGLPASEVSFSSDLNSVIAVYDLDCFECASVDTTSSTTTSSAVSTTATGTPIDCSQLDPENPPPCDELGIVRGSPNVLYTALNSLTPELCAQLCEDTDGCKSFGIGDDGAASFCEIWDLPADELDFVVDEASPFRIWGLECFVCDGGATTTTTTTSATSSLTFTNSSTTSLSSTTPSLSRSSDISSSSSLEVTEPPTSTPSNTASSASDTASSTSVAPSMDAKNLPIIGDKSFLGCLGSTPGFLGFEVVGVDPLMTTIECVGLATDFNYAGVHQE